MNSKHMIERYLFWERRKLYPVTLANGIHFWHRAVLRRNGKRALDNAVKGGECRSADSTRLIMHAALSLVVKIS